MAIYKAWLSDCGHYYALEAPCHQLAYDVIEIAGARIWLHYRYDPTGWDDTDVRYTHTEFPGLVTGWTNYGRWTRDRRRYITAFSLNFADMRQDIQVLPYRDRDERSPWLAAYHAEFQRQRRVSRGLWATLQGRIAQAITDGHRSLYMLQDGRQEGSYGLG